MANKVAKVAFFGIQKCRKRDVFAKCDVVVRIVNCEWRMLCISLPQSLVHLLQTNPSKSYHLVQFRKSKNYRLVQFGIVIR